MYITDLKNEFYEFLAGKRIFIIVNYDIDSICTCKILQSLLKHKQTLYSVAVVQGVNDLRNVFQENCKDVNYFVLINCGGTIDIVEELKPPDEVVFFLLDSHKPTDIYNVYSADQIRLLWDKEEDRQVPAFHDVFSEDEVDDEQSEEEDVEEIDDEDGSESRTTKRRRLEEETVIKRREKRIWEMNKNKLLFEYTQFTYYSKASAIIMFDLAWKLNKDDKDLLWYAIVALTEQMLFGKIENTLYVIETENLQAHANRLRNRSNDIDVATSVKITFEKDLRLVLYRQWSVESSLKYSMFTACKLKLWSFRGDKKLHELLADMGLPLVQSRQNYHSMDLQLRQEFHGCLERLAEKYGLSDIVYATFVLSYGYRYKYCAADFVYGMLAILEAAPRDKKPEECLQAASDCLIRTKREILNTGVERAKIVTCTLFKTVQGALDMKRIIQAGPFIYYIVQEGSLDWHIFSHQHMLMLLAQFILQSYVAMSRNRNRASSLSLIVSAPKDMENSTCVIMGVPPVCENSPKNFFGKAFEQAADEIKCDNVEFDYFNTSFFELPIRLRTRFLDALTSILTIT